MRISFESDSTAVTHTPTPLQLTLRSFLESLPDGPSVARVDLDRRARLTAVLRHGLGEHTSLSGVEIPWSTPGRPPRTFLPARDPHLFHPDRPLEARGGPDLTVREDATCFAYRPFKRAVFAASQNGECVYVKLRRRAAPDGLASIGHDTAVWPARTHRTVDASGSLEAWRSAGSHTLRELRSNRDAYRNALAATAETLARLAQSDPSLPAVTESSLLENTARHLERQHLLFGDGATSDDLQTVSAALRGSRGSSARAVTVHGDLHDGQVFLDDTGHARFIDPDSLATGPLEWDVANLAAHVDLGSVRAGSVEPDTDAVEHLRRSFKDALPMSLATLFSDGRFHSFRSLALLRLSAVYGCRPPWRHVSDSLRRLALRSAMDLVRAALVVLTFLASSSADASVLRLRQGTWVEVEGEHRPGKRFKAEEVQVKNPDVGRLPEVQARIESIDVEHGRVSVLGIEVELDPAAILNARSVSVALETIPVGTPVELSGLSHVSGNRWRAASLRTLEAWRDDDAEVEGYVTSVHRSPSSVRFEVNGIPVRADADVEFEVDADAVHLLAAPMRVSGSDRSRSSDDWQPRGTSWLHRNITFGGRITARVLDTREMDLDDTQEDDLTESNVSARLFGRWQPSPWFETYVEVRGSNREALRADPSSPFEGGDRTEFQSGPTYVFYRPPTLSNVAAQIGRVDVEEDREWFYDDNLDGLRLFFANDHVHSEFGVYRTSIDPKEDVDDEKYVVLALESRTFDAVAPAFYYIDRRDRRDTRNLRHWIGARLPIDTRHVEVWGDGVIAQGQYRDKRLRTWAADAGLLLKWQGPFRGSVYGGYAAGSGDRDRGDQTDREYRDTGLADNTGVMDGLKSFAYYGELTDPELMNLRVWTAGAGFYATSWMSVDVVLHGYRQMHLRDRFRSEIPLRPEGVDKDLGRELDVFVGIRGPLPVDMELGYARFEPGLAFATRKTADQFRVEVEWRR